jgi:hypothetical protein
MRKSSRSLPAYVVTASLCGCPFREGSCPSAQRLTTRTLVVVVVTAALLGCRSARSCMALALMTYAVVIIID